MGRAIQRLWALPVLLLLTGCPQTTPDQSTGDQTAGDVSGSALSFGGSVSGLVETVSSTDTSATPASARKSAQRRLGADAIGFITDLNGARLRDKDGNEYPEFPVSVTGDFGFDGLPVGVDLILNVILDGDNQADLRSIFNIPKDAGADSGALDEVPVDPLSTLILAKLFELLDAQNVDPRTLDISPSGLVQRIRDAFEHLFADSGIEQDIAIDDLLGLSGQQLAELFDNIVPRAARRGMQMAEGNIALSVATDVEDVVRAVARILIEGGFVILDDPGGVDLSFLAGLPNVRKMTFEQFHEEERGMIAGEMLRTRPGGLDLSAFNAPPQTFLYFSTVAELDRNFANHEEMMPRDRGPWFADHVLARMARLHLAGKTISLGDLHRLMVDTEFGMAARLMYSIWSPNTGPVDMFASADGKGVSKNPEDLFNELDRIDAFDIDPDKFERAEAAIRDRIVAFLQGTDVPSFEQIFDGILTDRIPSADAFARRIRDRRAHLPFSRSGPSRFFVVATGDKFRNPNAQPVTVDVVTEDEGKVTRVTYNAAGTGKFYVGFGPMTDRGMQVELISRRTGHPLREHDGEQRMLDLADTNIFGSVNGRSFFEAFSETGTNFPGGPALQVPNFGFDPSLPPDPETNPPVWEVWVLLTSPAPGAAPVRVDYADGVATFNPNGRYFLMFDETTERDGTFGLIEENGEPLEQTPGRFETRVLLTAADIQGATFAPETFTQVFGVDVPNPGYDPSGAPFYDDINGNGVEDATEPSFDFREFLWNPGDWRSTNVETYYRRADNNGFVRPENIDWDADTPRTLDGVALVPRSLKPRLNAFRFGRPNVTINLLMAFSPPAFFNGTQALDANTRLNPFMILAFANLVFDSIHNVPAMIDPDGSGPLPASRELVEAHLFVPPVGDPVQLLVNGAEELATGAP